MSLAASTASGAQQLLKKSQTRLWDQLPCSSEIRLLPAHLAKETQTCGNRAGLSFPDQAGGDRGLLSFTNCSQPEHQAPPFIGSFGGLPLPPHLPKQKPKLTGGVSKGKGSATGTAGRTGVVAAICCEQDVREHVLLSAEVSQPTHAGWAAPLQMGAGGSAKPQRCQSPSCPPRLSVPRSDLPPLRQA